MVEVNLSSWLGLIFLIVLISIGGMLIVRKNIGVEYLRSHHDVTDPLLAVLGTLFAILLGFVLANSMQRFEDARITVRDEAGAVGDIMRIADGMPNPTKSELQTSCVRYVDAVIDDEWKEMEKGKMSVRAQKTFGELWRATVHYDPATQGQSNLHQELIVAMSKAGECRRARDSQLTYALPKSLWVVVLIGAAATIIFTFFFAVQDIKIQIFMNSAIALVVGLNVYMIAGFDAPYSGDIHITSAPFESDRALFQYLKTEKENSELPKITETVQKMSKTAK